MASGISNTFRLAGVAVGVAALGALLENRVENALSTTAGGNTHALGAAVSSAGTRAVAGRPDLVEPAKTAFASGLNDVIVGRVGAARGRAPSPPSSSSAVQRRLPLRCPRTPDAAASNDFVVPA